MKKINKIDIYFTISVFILFLIMCICSPLMGDDYGNYINGSGGILYTLKYAVYAYNSYEGRFISRIFLTILTYNKFIWNIINPIIISAIYYLILKITNHKDKYITPILVFLAILLVDEEAFRQVYVWIAGNMTYLPPMITVFYIVYLNINKNILHKKTVNITLPIITLISSIFVENLSVCLVVELSFFLIYYYIKNKKLNISMLTSLICSITGLLIIILSPGTMNRLDTYHEFNKLNIIEKVIYNIPNFINYTFIRNSFLVFLVSVCIILLVNMYIKRKYIKYFIYIYMSVLPLLTAIINYIKTFGINISKLDFFLNYNNLYINLFWIGYIIIAIIVIIKYILKTKDYINLSLIIIGVLSNASMMISPIWGGRTSYATTICLSVAMINIIKSFKFIEKDNKIIKLVFGSILTLFIIFFIWGYINVYKVNNLREKYITNQLKKDKEEIDVIVLSERFLWNSNPWDPNGYLAKTFKQYYHIDKNKKIKLIFLENGEIPNDK